MPRSRDVRPRSSVGAGKCLLRYCCCADTFTSPRGGARTSRSFGLRLEIRGQWRGDARHAAIGPNSLVDRRQRGCRSEPSPVEGTREFGFAATKVQPSTYGTASRHGAGRTRDAPAVAPPPDHGAASDSICQMRGWGDLRKFRLPHRLAGISASISPFRAFAFAADTKTTVGRPVPSHAEMGAIHG